MIISFQKITSESDSFSCSWCWKGINSGENKNVACFGGQLFFQFFNNYSIQTLYDSFNLTFYNIFWTSLPIFIFGLLEQNLKSKHLLNNPSLYQRISKNRLLKLREFLLWFLTGLWHAVAIYFGWYLYFVYGLNITEKGKFNI